MIAHGRSGQTVFIEPLRLPKLDVGGPRPVFRSTYPSRVFRFVRPPIRLNLPPKKQLQLSECGMENLSAVAIHEVEAERGRPPAEPA